MLVGRGMRENATYIEIDNGVENMKVFANRGCVIEGDLHVF